MVNQANSMKKHIEELIKSVSFMRSQFDNFNNTIGCIASVLKSIKTFK